MNIVPTTTGAASAIGLVILALKGKLDGISLRVPTPTVSVVDLVANLKKSATREEINAALENAANNGLRGILSFCNKPLVSSDFRGDSASSIELEGKMAKVIAWYDNEWGYCCRVGDLAALIAERA